MAANGRKWAAVFYWIGVTMAVACVALVLAGHLIPGMHERESLPLSWPLGGIALLAFLAVELCDSMQR